MVGSPTVLPAMRSKLGDRIDDGRIPFIGKRMAARTESRAWPGLLDRVLKRPLAAALISGGLLVALSIPALGLHTANAGTAAIPASSPVMQTYSRITDAFRGAENAAQVVVEAGDLTKPEVAGAIERLERKATATWHGDRRRHPRRQRRQDGRHGQRPHGRPPQRAKSVAGLESLREDLVPATVGQVPAPRRSSAARPRRRSRRSSSSGSAWASRSRSS